mgnify:CR=1 FL=1
MVAINRTVKAIAEGQRRLLLVMATGTGKTYTCLLYTSDAADERSSVDLGGRRIIKKKKTLTSRRRSTDDTEHTHIRKYNKRLLDESSREARESVR